MSKQYDVIVIGGGAAGLMCAAQAGQRGRRTLLIEHNEELGKKILISGGGRCNFTNLYTSHEDYLSGNEHFCKSALARYTQWDFLKLIDDYQIPYHEKTLGQQFCDDTAKDIVELLVAECRKGQVDISTATRVDSIQGTGPFEVATQHQTLSCTSLVIATGALSFPRLGATDFGHQVAKQYDIAVTSLTPALVPFTFDKAMRQDYEDLSGISLDAQVSYQHTQFRENILFTHKGLSGPAILQISSYWEPGQAVEINLLPELDFDEHLAEQRQSNPKQQIKTLLSQLFPKRFAEHLCQQLSLEEINLASLSKSQAAALKERIQPWSVIPAGTEGYRKAEVCLGGVDTRELSSRTMESNRVPGLYFIGEVVDVTGHLGGFNFQWAWSSGYCAGQFV